jgi:hypothetical protein
MRLKAMNMCHNSMYIYMLLVSKCWDSESSEAGDGGLRNVGISVKPSHGCIGEFARNFESGP